MTDDRKTTRRALLAGAAAVPALALASTLAAAAAAPDPVFAAIERHRHACAAVTAAYKEVAAAENRIPEQFRGLPWVPVPVRITTEMDIDAPEIGKKLKFWRCSTAKHIDEALATNCNPERHPELRRRALKKLRAERAKIARASHRAGFPQAEKQASIADEREIKLLGELALTVPTTAAGARAVLGYWTKHYRDEWKVDDDIKMSLELMASVETVLEKLAASEARHA